MTTIRIVADRIGTHTPAPWTLDTNIVDDEQLLLDTIAYAIDQVAARHLFSAEWSVTVRADGGWNIEAGRYGTGTWAIVDPLDASGTLTATTHPKGSA